MAQAVDVEDGHEIIQIVVRTEGQCLPNGAFPRLTISQKAEHPVAGEGEKKFRTLLGSLQGHSSKIISWREAKEQTEAAASDHQVPKTIFLVHPVPTQQLRKQL